MGERGGTAEDERAGKRENVTSGGDTESRRERDESDRKLWFLFPSFVLDQKKKGKRFMSGSEMPAGEFSRGATCFNCAEMCGSGGEPSQTN